MATEYITREEAVKRATAIAAVVPNSVMKRYATSIVVRTADNTKTIVQYHQIYRDTARELGLEFGLFHRMRSAKERTEDGKQ